MKNVIRLLIVGLGLVLATGCAKGNLSPFSRTNRAQQRIENSGKIEQIKSAQDAIVKEVGQIRSEIQGNQNKTLNTTGTANSANSGVQILSGDGVFVVVFGLGAMLILGTTAVFYRMRAAKAEKTAEIFAQQIALHATPNLEDGVLLAAMNSPVEGHIYQLLLKQQNLLGRRQGSTS